MTRAEALRDLRLRLSSAGFEASGLDARLLLLGALGISATELTLRPDLVLSPEEAERLSLFAARRLTHEPVARILGEREFWGLPFALSPETLVPRPDTETVVETALRLVPDRAAPHRLIDFGTGSGILLVALLHEWPQARGVGVDRSFAALRSAKRNAARNNVGERAMFVASDWGSSIRGSFDVIVSNPPYIASSVIGGLAPDVRQHDPRLALDGGEDGLDAYRILLGEAERLLVPQGLLILEIGYDQGDALRSLATGRALEILELVHDLAGNPRCVALKRT